MNDLMQVREGDDFNDKYNDKASLYSLSTNSNLNNPVNRNFKNKKRIRKNNLKLEDFEDLGGERVKRVEREEGDSERVERVEGDSERDRSERDKLVSGRHRSERDKNTLKQYPLPMSLSSTNLSLADLLINNLIRELDECVKIKQQDQLMNEMIRFRERLVSERNKLLDKIYNGKKDLNLEKDLEKDLEILNSQISFLTNEKIKEIQNEICLNSNYSSFDDSLSNLINILKSLSVKEADEIFRFIIEEIVNLKISEKTLEMTIKSLKEAIKGSEVGISGEGEGELGEGREGVSEGREGIEVDATVSGRLSSEGVSGSVSQEVTREPLLHDYSTTVESLNKKVKKPSIKTSSIDPSKWDCKSILKGHIGQVYSLFHNNDNKLYSTSQDSSLNIWDLDSGNLLNSISFKEGPIKCLKIINNLLIIGHQSFIKLFDLSSLKLIKQLSLHSNDIECFSLNNNNSILFSGSSDSTISILDLNSFNCLNTLSNHKSSVFSLQSHNSYLFSASRDHSVKLYNLNSFEYISTLYPPHYDAVQSLCISQNYLYSGSRDYSLKVWDLNHMNKWIDNNSVAGNSPIKDSKSPTFDDAIPKSTFNQITTNPLLIPIKQTIYSAHKDWIKTIIPFHKQNHIVSASRDGIIKLWDTTNQSTLVHEQPLHSASINDLCLLNSTLVASCSSDRTIKIWKPSQL
ncbi:WD40 repeat-like protein [Rozella allomycis CSF55]|uniref:WD40 repeat-like protein n=1 Tax=Rozella allomycis (strain CSF55) TaxID=988480 RepID=A0A4V1IZW4_ROZAC|nr:WD40 repeat-like protein [Rozella allomycis CSF55]